MSIVEIVDIVLVSMVELAEVVVAIGDGKSGSGDGRLGGCEYGENGSCSDCKYRGDGRSGGVSGDGGCVRWQMVR